MPKVGWTSDIRKVLRDDARLKADMVKMQRQLNGVAGAGTKATKSAQGAVDS